VREDACGAAPAYLAPMSTTNRVGLLVGLYALSTLAGCGPAPTRESEEAEQSTGAETTATGPTGPAPSFLPDGQHVYARIDIARIRRSPVGPDISSAIRATETWQRYAGSSGLDPVTSFDALVIAADAVYADRRTILVRHTGTDADVREAILRMSVAHEVAPTWSEMEGFPVVVPPSTLPIEHSLTLTAAHELVFGPTEDLARVVSVARDHAARRAAPEDAIDPQLVFGAHEVATFRVDEPPPRREGWPEPPLRYRVEVVEDETTHTANVHIRAEYATPALCHTSHEFLQQQATYYAGQMLVRAAGLNRPLEEAVFTEDGANLDATTSFTTDEIRRALGAMALMQLSGGR
jgi:hypothetical protein